MRAFPLGLLAMTLGLLLGQQATPPLPSPPPPPRFMGMKGLPLSCFNQPNFEEDGLEFFVCNGGGGVAGVRKQNDPAHTIYVRDPEIAQNLNMKLAKQECGSNQFFVRSDPGGLISFGCKGKEIRHDERFKCATKADWKRFDRYLN